MPNLADITVKKYDGTTDIIYAGVTPSGPDGSFALWRSNAHPAPYPGLKPELRLAGRWNGGRNARRMDFAGVYRSVATNSTTTISSAIGAVQLTGSLLLPFNVPATDTNEGVAQLTNLLVSTLIRSCFLQGQSAT